MSQNEFDTFGDGAEQPSNVVWRSLRLWFTLRDDVDRREYMATGVSLMLFKYAVEAWCLWAVSGVIFTPWDFLFPMLSVRENLMRGGPEWLGWAWFVWTLPFLWIAVSMSVRRVSNAGLSPWLGLLVFVPILNLFCMVLFAVLPVNPRVRWAYKGREQSDIHRVRSAILGMAAGLMLSLLMVAIGVYLFGSYGASVFLGTPIVVGAVCSLVFNSPAARSYPASIAMGMISVVVAGAALLAFALEGLICILMAAPIALPLGALGGAIGKAIADTTVRPIRGVAAVIVCLPLWAGAESFYQPQREFVVLTVVVIDAPIDRVWQNVVRFPQLSEPREWYFRMGISYPTEARIEGTGVGATRYCVFSTGTFVEPITTWDEPRHLAFDVSKQPDPMFELSPYRDVHPPHLDGALRSRRGEFRLIELPAGRTRLEGRTWYEFEMYPQSYWTLWSDLLIHRIHRRVLQHIKQLSENGRDVAQGD